MLFSRRQGGILYFRNKDLKNSILKQLMETVSFFGYSETFTNHSPVQQWLYIVSGEARNSEISVLLMDHAGGTHTSNHENANASGQKSFI